MSASRGGFWDDLRAGLTVAMVAAPQSIAFAALAGLPPEAGLWSAIVMPIVGAPIAGSFRINIGPAVTTSSMLLAILLGLAAGAPETWPGLAALLALEVGAFTVVAALLGVDRILRFLSRSVLMAFTVGSALLIVVTQSGELLGLASTSAATAGGALLRLFAALPGLASATTPLLAVAVIAALILLRRLGPRFPAPLVVLALAALAVRFAGLEVETIGRIELARPTLAHLPLERALDGNLVGGALALALIGIIQTLSLAGALAKRGEQPVAGRDVLAIGASNLAASAIGGFPGTASFARSALADIAGARSRWTSILAGIATAAIAWIAAPAARHLPAAAISALLVLTAVRLIDWSEVRTLLAQPSDDRLAFLVTVAAVVLIPIHWALLLGVGVSVARFLERASRLHLNELLVGPSSIEEVPLDAETGRSRIVVLGLDGSLFFAHAAILAQRLGAIVDRQPEAIVLRLRRAQQIDYSVLTALDATLEPHFAGGGRVYVCGLSPILHQTIAASDLGRRIGGDALFPSSRQLWSSLADALKTAEAALTPSSDRPVRRVR